MTLFAYAGRDTNGRKVRGWVEGETPKAARQALHERGVLAERLTPAVATKNSLTTAGRARLYREFGAMLRAGFTLERTLGMLIAEEAGSDQQRQGFLIALRQQIRNGLPLSSAITLLAPRLSPFEKTALEAAEQTGMQGAMLEQLADFIEAQLAIVARLRGALVYPAAVLVLAFSILSLLMFVVLPQAARLFGEFADGLPTAARLLMTWGPRLMLLLLILAGTAAIAGAWLYRATRHDAIRAARLEQWLWRIHLVRSIQERLWSLRFAGTMSLLVAAGVAPQEALAVAGAATGSYWLTQAAGERAAAVRQGESLSAAIAALPPLRPHLLEWVRVGESAGNLREMLEQAALRARQGYENRLARLLALLEPALIFAVGLAVLAVAYTVLKPMLDLARSATHGL